MDQNELLKSLGLLKEKTSSSNLTNYENLTDEELVDLCKNGIKEAFSVLVTRHQAKIWKFTINFGVNREDIRGITQAIFLQCYININNFKKHSKFTTWLYVIAKNRCYNWNRRVYLNKEFISTEESNITTPPNPEEITILFQDQAKVRKAMDLMKPKYKELLILHYFNSFSYDEIANMLDISPRTVETRLYRGRKQFKAIYKLQK